MSNVFNELGSEMESHARKIEHKADALRREQIKEEKQILDKQQKTEEAKKLAIDERKETLNWAWAAASLLNMSDEPASSPEMWEYTHTIIQKRRFFGHKALELTGIAAYGWHLLDWQNTRYHPSPRHTLILTPQDENKSVIYLRFFSQSMNNDGTYQQVEPNNVRELSKEPLSALDMPWPGFIDKSSGSDHLDYLFNVTQQPPMIAPWQHGARSIKFSGFDISQESFGGDWELSKQQRLDSFVHKHIVERPKSERDYKEYRRTGVEETIRRAITEVAAEKLLVKPEDMILEIRRQAKQNN